MRDEEQHVAFIVEDDPLLAQEFQELMGALGFQCIHTTALDEALRIVKDKKFCFVIMDVQIKSSTAFDKARVEAGHTLLKKLRAVYPHRNRDGHHHLQIIAMSGHAKDSNAVSWLLKNGADDFIVKPLGNNDQTPVDKVIECLKKSKRTDHKNCEAIAEYARNGQYEQVAKTTLCQLNVSGREDKDRTEAVINGNSVLLSEQLFYILLKLVVGSELKENNGWIHKTDLGATPGGSFKNISRLNKLIKPFWDEELSLYDNNKKGSYRLNQKVRIQINHTQLLSHSIKKIRALAQQLSEKP